LATVAAAAAADADANAAHNVSQTSVSTVSNSHGSFKTDADRMLQPTRRR